MNPKNAHGLGISHPPVVLGRVGYAVPILIIPDRDRRAADAAAGGAA